MRVHVPCHGACAHLSSACVRCAQGGVRAHPSGVCTVRVGRVQVWGVCVRSVRGCRCGGVHPCEQAAYGFTERVGVLCVCTHVCAHKCEQRVFALCEYGVHGGGAHTRVHIVSVCPCVIMAVHVCVYTRTRVRGVWVCAHPCPCVRVPSPPSTALPCSQPGLPSPCLSLPVPARPPPRSP